MNLAILPPKFVTYGHISCNCAVGIRSGDDVIMFTVCSRGPSPARVGEITLESFIRGTLTPGTRVLHDTSNDKFEVCRYKLYIYVYICHEFSSYVTVHILATIS